MKTWKNDRNIYFYERRERCFSFFFLNQILISLANFVQISQDALETFSPLLQWNNFILSILCVNTIRSEQTALHNIEISVEMQTHIISSTVLNMSVLKRREICNRCMDFCLHCALNKVTKARQKMDLMSIITHIHLVAITQNCLGTSSGSKCSLNAPDPKLNELHGTHC